MARPLVAGVLAALLILTTQAMAQARAGMGAGGVMIACVGGEVVTMPVDADGRPQDAGHVCPDCALTLAAGPVYSGARPGPVRTVELHSLSPTPLAPRAQLARPRARDPPLAA